MNRPLSRFPVSYALQRLLWSFGYIFSLLWLFQILHHSNPLKDPAIKMEKPICRVERSSPTITIPWKVFLPGKHCLYHASTRHRLAWGALKIARFRCQYARSLCPVCFILCSWPCTDFRGQYNACYTLYRRSEQIRPSLPHVILHINFQGCKSWLRSLRHIWLLFLRAVLHVNKALISIVQCT